MTTLSAPTPSVEQKLDSTLRDLLAQADALSERARTATSSVAAIHRAEAIGMRIAVLAIMRTLEGRTA